MSQWAVRAGVSIAPRQAQRLMAFHAEQPQPAPADPGDELAIHQPPGRHQRLRRLAEMLPKTQQASTEVRELLRGAQDATVTLVHVIHRRNACETQTKDYEFSHLSMTEHWQAGSADMLASLQLLDRQGVAQVGEFRVLDPHPDAHMARHPFAVTPKENQA